jgi:hypothetical protein
VTTHWKWTGWVRAVGPDDGVGVQVEARATDDSGWTSKPLRGNLKRPDAPESMTGGKGTQGKLSSKKRRDRQRSAASSKAEQVKVEL